MEALLGALEALRAPARTRRGLALLAMLALGTTLGGVAFAQNGADPHGACLAGADRLSEAVADLLPELSGKLSSADLGPETLSVIKPRLEGYARAWSRIRKETCDATWRGGEQSKSGLDLRMACLDRRALHLRSLLDTLAEPSSEILIAAPRAVSALPGLDACTRTEELTRTALPVDAPPERAAALASIEAALDRASARADLGQLAGLSEELRRQVAAARELGHDPTLAEALHLLAVSLLRSGDEGREAILRESYVVAQRAQADEAALEASIALSNLAYGDKSDFKDAAFWADTAQALATRMQASPRVFARIAAERGYAAMYSMEYEEAVAHLDEATAAIAELPEGQVLRLRLNINRAQVLDLSGHSEKALTVMERTLAELPEHYGPRHPVVLKARSTHATILLGMGRLAKSRAAYRELLEAYEASPLPHRPQRITVYLNLGEVERQDGDYDAAEKSLGRAIELLDAGEPISRHYLTAYFNLSAVFEFQGRYEEGLVAARNAVAQLPEDVAKSDPQLLASTQVNTAVMLLRLERFTEAGAMLDESLFVLRAELGDAHASLTHPLKVRAMAGLLSEQWAPAAVDTRAALDLLGERAEADAWQRAELEGMLGEALLELGEVDEARTRFEASLKVVGEDAVVAGWFEFLLARVDAAQGRPEQARAGAQKACGRLAKAESQHDRARHQRCVAWLDAFDSR
jgi:tetratricopeptide (TPR) repeat protein